MVSPSPSYTGNRHLTRPRSFASPARTHVTHDTNPKPKSISRLGSQKDSPPNLQYTVVSFDSLDLLKCVTVVIFESLDPLKCVISVIVESLDLLKCA